MIIRYCDTSLIVAILTCKYSSKSIVIVRFGDIFAISKGVTISDYQCSPKKVEHHRHHHDLVVRGRLQRGHLRRAPGSATRFHTHARTRNNSLVAPSCSSFIRGSPRGPTLRLTAQRRRRHRSVTKNYTRIRVSFNHLNI